MKMKKIVALLAAVIMTLCMAMPVFAEDPATVEPTGKITIQNSTKGLEYNVYKLFDAYANSDNEIASYYGNIPESLTDYFEVKNNTIVAKYPTVTPAMADALAAWTEGPDAAATDTGNGADLVFDNLSYGYYVVITAQGASGIAVDSIQPDAVIFDKNTTPPVKDLSKVVTKTTSEGKKDIKYYVGEEIPYEISFKTANYNGKKKIVEYTIIDTLPTGMEIKSVDSLTIDGDAVEPTPEFDEAGKIVIPWVSADAEKECLYTNGCEVVLTYTAVLTDEAAIAGVGNKNEVEIQPKDEDEEIPGDPLDRKTSETVYTYAVAIQKVNTKAKNLAGAEFEIPYALDKVSEGTATEPTVWVVTGKAADSKTTVVTPESGVVIIKGVDEAEITVYETKAPAGYNAISEGIVLKPSMTEATKTSTIEYLDEKGNVTETVTDTKVIFSSDDINTGVKVVVNKSGSILPSTGGVGTTMFYIVGGIIIAAAVVILVVKRRRA